MKQEKQAKQETQETSYVGNARYPRSRLEKLGVKDTFVVSVIDVEKLGVKDTFVVSVIDVDDDSFHRELEGRAAAIATGRKPRAASDMIVYGVTAKPDLDRLTAFRGSIVPAGAIWVLWPKGRKELREDNVRNAAIAQGLVDIKVMSFSETLSALKLVIPVAQRPAVKTASKTTKPAKTVKSKKTTKAAKTAKKM
jgi:hypothetical protein